jgi:uncharacterized membrane protein
MTTVTDPPFVPPHLNKKPGVAPLRRVVRRVVFGLLFVLPILLTVLVVYQIYLILHVWVIAPVALLIMPEHVELPYWKAVERYVTPPITLLVVGLLLYLLGYVFQSRLNHWIDWVFDRIPGISILYRAVRDASRAIQGPDGLKTIDTVVLVPFPHANVRATGYLMGESQDTLTGRPLVCVYIPIALFPPSGYTLVYPREEVTFTQWDSSAPWKLMISGGLTVPAKVPFYSGSEETLP